MDWTDEKLRKDALKLAKESIDRSDLRAKLEALTGETVSSDMLRNAWKRWETKKEAPPLDAVIGGGPKGQEAKPHKMVYPQGTKPMEEPVEHTGSRVGALPKFLIADGDLHYPISDPYVEAAKLKFAQDIKPDTWVNVGDCYDFWPISSHDKEPDRWLDGSGMLQAEFNSAKPYWKEVCRVTKNDVHLLLGNHENRLNRLINANMGLFKLDAFEWKNMASLPDKVTVHKYGKQFKIGPVTFEHGDRIGGRFGVQHPAFWLLQNKGNRSTIFGHTHRQNTYYRTVFDENGEPHSYVAHNQGHGSDTKKQTYAYEPQWIHGFTLVEFYTEAGKPRFTLYPITVINGKFSFNGKVYDGHK